MAHNLDFSLGRAAIAFRGDIKDIWQAKRGTTD